MSYSLKETNKTTILNVLVGVDESLVGLKIKNSIITSMTFQEFYGIVMQAYGVKEINRLNDSLSSHRVLPVNDSKLFVLETVTEDDFDVFAPDLIIKALKLYHSADVYSCYTINYRVAGNKICFGGIGHTLKYVHAIGLIAPQYSLTQDEKKAFPQWYKSTFPKLIDTNRSDTFRAMVRMYDTSYLIGICELEYVVLFTILEMMFEIEGENITANIAKGTSRLLGKNAKEKGKIRNQMVTLYNIRSRYIHDGKDVPHSDLFALREIVRKVLVEICNRGCHTKDKSLEELRDSLLAPPFQSQNTLL